MAEQADGSIIVDTEIDAKGFKADSAELQRAIKSLNTKVENLGPTLQKAFSGSASALSAFDSKSAALENTISELEKRLESLGEKKVPTKDYENITAQCEKAEQALFKLYDRQDKMQATGVKENSRAWQSLQYDIQIAKENLERFEREKSRMESAGTAFQMGSNTAEYAQLESALTSAKNRLSEMQTQAEGARDSTSRLTTAGNVASKAFGKIGSIGKKAFSRVANAAKTGINNMRQFAKSSNSGETAIAKLGKKITGLGSMLKRAVLRKIISSIISGLKESMDNLARYSSNVNGHLSTLKSGLTQLKNSFAAAFAPILTIVTPILSTLINYLSIAVTYIGKLFAALTGTKTFTKATAVQENYAASLDKTSDSAKEAKRQLASFDKMNVLNDDSSGGSGGGGGGVSPSEMFEEVPIEDNISDFANKLKKALNNADWEGLGRLLGKKVNEVVDKIKWSDFGAKVGKGINGGIQTAYYFLDEVNFTNIGGRVAEFLNGALEKIDFTFAGKLLIKAFATIPDTLIGFITELKWGLVANKLSEFIKGIFDGATDWMNDHNWSDLGSKFYQNIKNVLSSIDYAGISNSLFTSLGTAIRSSAEFFGSFFGDVGGDINKWFKAEIEGESWNEIADNILTKIGEGFSDIGTWAKEHIIQPFVRGLLGESAWEKIQKVKEKFKKIIDILESLFGINSPSTVMHEDGGYIVEGLFKGITDKLKSIGTWIKENIFDPFINGFKKVFGIHSPSTVMEEQGGYIIEGLWQGLKNSWSDITDFFSKKLDGIKSTVSTAWENIKTTASTKWTLIKTTLSTAWDGLKSTASTKWENLKNTVSAGWDNIKTNASQKWDGIKTELSQKADTIKTMLNGKDWKSIGSNICSGIRNGINAGWNWLKNTVSNVADNLLSSAKKSLGIHSPSKLFHDEIGLNIGYGIGEGISDSESTVIKTVSGIAEAISEEFSDGTYSMGEIFPEDNINNSLSAFSDTITDNFSNLIDKLQNIAKNVTFTAPVVSSGRIIPHGMSGQYPVSVNKNECSDEAPIGSIKQALSEVLAARSGNENINLTVELDGSVIYKTVVERNRQNFKKTGVNALGY